MSDEVVVPGTSRWIVDAPNGGNGLRVTLSYPIRGVTGPVPVLVLLDGDSLFLTATEFVRTVNLVSLGEFPPVAVVGVMRDETDPVHYMASRFRDFCPQEWVLPGPFADDNAMAFMGTGRAADFLGELERGVLPEVQSRMEAVGIEMSDFAIGGWSLSGLFASWVWLERPDLFPHLLAISPSLWWHDASILDSDFTTRPASHRAFICAGEHEEGDVSLVYPRLFANGPQRELAAMVRNAEKFARKAAAAGASVDSMVFAGENHITVQAAAIARGAKHLFA